MRRTYSFLLACLLLAGLLAGCQTPSEPAPEPAPEPVVVSCLTGVEVIGNRSGHTHLWHAYTYNANGQILEKSYRDGDGMTVYERRTYNEKGVLISFEDYERNLVYIYDSQGKPLTITESNSSETYTYEYDKDGNVSKKTIEYTGENPRSVTYVYTYDAQGRKTSENNGERLDTYTYDSQGRIIRQTIGNRLDTFTYDSQGRIIRQTIGNRLDTFTYDSQGRITRETSGDRVTTYTYDADGNLLCVLTERNGVFVSQTDYSYNENGQLLEQKETSSSGNRSKVVYTYDDQGNLLTKETLQGDKVNVQKYIPKTKNTYDFAGNCIKVETYRDGVLSLTRETAWTYDAQGRKLSMYSQQGNSTWMEKWTYDDYGNISTWQTDEVSSFRFTYQQIAVPAAKAKSVQKEQEGLLQYVMGLVRYPTY